VTVGLETALVAAVGSAHVTTDPDLRAGYEVDWMGRRWGTAVAVVRPGNVAEVAEVLLACAAQGAHVVVQGGNTGLSGGGVPGGGEVLLSTTRLSQVGVLDRAMGEVTVGAGASLADVRRVARAEGWDVGVDLASRDSATIGGMVATNAGGLRVLRHGTMKAQVRGVRAVLADGSVIDRLTGPSKDSSGYDLTSLLAGSEGTLAVITDVRLRLVPVLPLGATAILRFDTLGRASTLVRRLVGSLGSLQSAEVVLGEAMDLLCAELGRPLPLTDAAPVYLLLDCEAADDPTPELLAALAELDGLDAVVASDRTGRARLWEYRERQSEVAGARGTPVKLDVALPLPGLDNGLASISAAVRSLAPDSVLVVFGHLAEGNLHVNVVGADLPTEQLTAAVLGIVASAGGSISAEHGIGRAKVGWLPLTRSVADVAAMAALKGAWDPAGLLAPGVLFESQGTGLSGP